MELSRCGDFGYPWPLSQGLWVKRHQKIPKISTKICQKQNTQAMLEFALARRSPFCISAHSFSCWIAGGENKYTHTHTHTHTNYYEDISPRLSSISSKRAHCQITGVCHKKESVSCSAIFNSAIPWPVALQALLSMGFPRQEYWSELPFPSPGDVPKPGIEPESPHCRRILYCLSHRGGCHTFFKFRMPRH